MGKKKHYTYAVVGEIVEDVTVVASSRREADERIYDKAMDVLMQNSTQWPKIHSMVLVSEEELFED